jgi:lipopolysaccharide transport system permease protein
MSEALGQAILQPAIEVPTVVIEPTGGWASLKFGAVWEYRELLFFLVWRDLKVRYKQTLLGVAWIVLQPLLSTVVFTLLFGVLLRAPSDGAPYALFALAGLVPWQYFSGSLSRVGTSLVNSAHLITKVYFPRLIIPLSGVISTLVDFAIGFGVLAILLIVYWVPLTWNVLWLPVFLLLGMVTALGFGLWLSALNVRYRDVNYLIPFMLQIWMYLTPVVYGSTLIPERFRFLLALNPMTGVVEGFRWALLSGSMPEFTPPGALFAVSVVIALLVLASGLVFFRNTEKTFADIV